MIIVTDAGSTTVKGKTLNISVTVVGKAITEGDVIIQAGELPYGYAVDESTSFNQYTYSSSDWVNSANLFLVGAAQHDVTIPEGVKVTGVTLYAVADNNSANKGKITELAGKTFSIDLPSRKNGTALAVATAENLNITGVLTFTVTYKSGVKLALQVESTGTGITELSTSGKNAAKVVKYVKDGKIIIEKGGKRYSVAGVEMK